MPHQCTTCGHAFDDGSKEMLGGCPDCGGNKFQFYPEGTEVPDEPPSDAETEVPEREEPTGAGMVGRAATAVRDFVADDEPVAPTDDPAAERDRTVDTEPDPNAAWPSEEDGTDDGGGTSEPTVGDSDIIDADARRESSGFEDAAQAEARDDVVTDEEFAGGVVTSDADSEGGTGDSPTDPSDEARIVSEPSGEEPDMADLREQLNDQFESIKVVEPGQYELNLMELYDREEYIIAIQENGKYVIEVPDAWDE
jgi:predicted  nucleic acid-binding Zn-ribbon protein